eukprot:210484_1
MPVHDDEYVYQILIEHVYEFNMNTLCQEIFQEKLTVQAYSASMVLIPDPKQLLIMGGIGGSMGSKTKKCPNDDWHGASNKCQIWQLKSSNPGKDEAVASLNYSRANAGSVYNHFYNNVIIGGGTHFDRGFVNTYKHYNHSFEIYDMKKDQWRLLPHRLNFNYVNYPSLWTDIWNHNAVIL